MERDAESEGLLAPVSRSLQGEGMEIESTVGEDVADDTAGSSRDLKRKTVQSRSINNSQTSKKRKPGNGRVLAGSSKRKRTEDASVKRSQPAAKKNGRSAASAALSSPGTSLNIIKPELSEKPDVCFAINQESSDDSEPLINKINKSGAKLARIRAKHAIDVNDSGLSIKNSKYASNTSQFPLKTAVLPSLSRFSDGPERTVKPLQNVGETVRTEHSFPVLKDFATKSLRTSKKKTKVSSLQSEHSLKKDEGEAATTFGDRVVPTKMSKTAKDRGDSVTAASITDSPHHVHRQVFSSEINNASLKWSNHKARHRKRTVSKQRLQTPLLSQSYNVRPTNVANEEQSLEQNAARMLSSRFSSQCGTFGLNGSSVAQQTTEPVDSSLPLNLQGHCQSDSKKTEIATPKQSTARALRPRKRRQKASGTRRYKEICFSETDAFKILDRRIKVFWPLDIKWYYGSVKSYDPTNKLHYVRYDDRDEEWLSLQNEKFKLQLLPGETAGQFKILENSARGKVGGRFTNGIQAVPETSHPQESNNEIHLSTVDNDAFTYRTENGSFKKYTSAVLDASCRSPRNGRECSSLKDDNNLVPLKDNDSIIEKVTFHNSSDKRKSGNVYVRRRYHKTGSGLKAINESVVKTGEGKVTGFQKLIEAGPSCSYIEKLEQDFCNGNNVGQSLFSNNSKHINILSPENNVQPERSPTSIKSQEFYTASRLEYLESGDNSEPAKSPEYKKELDRAIAPLSFTCDEISINDDFKLLQSGHDSEPSKLRWPEDNMVPETITIENKPEHLQVAKFSNLSAGSGKDLLSYQGSDLAPMLIHSLEEYQPLGGAVFVSHMDLIRYLITPGVSIRCVISSKELHREHPILSLWNFLPLLYPGYGLKHVFCHNNLIPKQCGMVLPVWPNVWMDILVVDNFTGSSLFSFGGSLWEVVNGFSRIMISVLNPLQNKCSCMFLGSMKLVDVQVPVPSVSVQISSSRGFSKPLVFVFYNFQAITRSKLKDLKRTLEVLCFFQQNSPLPSSNNVNLCLFGSCSGQMSGHMVFKDSVMFVEDSGTVSVSDMTVPLFQPRASTLNALRKSSCHDMDYRFSFTPESRKVNLCRSASPNCRRNGFGVNFESGPAIPSFFLTFAAAPSSFLGLHLKMLFGKPFDSTGFQNLGSDSSDLEKREMTDPSDVGNCDASTVEVSSMKTVQTVAMVFSGGHTADSSATRCLTAKHSKVDVDASPISTADGWVMSSPRSSYSELNVTGNAAGLPAKQDSRDHVMQGNALKLRRCLMNRGSWQFSRSSRPRSAQGLNSSVIEFEVEGCSHMAMNGGEEAAAGQFVTSCVESAQVEPDTKQGRQAVYAELFTAQGNFWDQDRNGTASQSQMWQDHRAQNVYNGFTEPRKRRSGFSNLIFGDNSDDVPFKDRGHLRRGRPSRQNKEDKKKKNSDNSSHLRMYLDSVFCSANILVVEVERGWRECGAQVVLESSDHNEWMLSVKLSGFTRYTHKAQQVLQSGTTNRYTHAMIWRGGKDWSLEFPDRKQWTLFKELHEECHNRNLRAASVRHIPIPGVRKIEDYDCSSNFVRPASRYIRQLESEVEMALATSRVMYDMDSEDEEWLGDLNSMKVGDEGCQPSQVSEETFERIMDLLEKAAFTQQRELLNSDEVADFCWDIAPVEVVKAIHAHWQEKRWRKGMALVRHFQPASWERYQQQIKEWESQISELQNLPASNKQQLMLERPSLFAFCLKPRGLEIPNKTQKHRPHRKFNAGKQITLRDQDSGICPATRKQGGMSIGEDNSSDALGYVYSSSPPHIDIHSQPGSITAVSLEAATQLDSMDFRLEMNNTFQQKQKMKLSRRKSKRMKIFVPSKDTQRDRISRCDLDHRKQYMSHSWETTSGDQWNDSCTSSKYNLPSVNSRHAYPPSDFDAELRVQEATNATRAAAELAAVKRAKAQRLLQKADLAIHKAAAAVVTAEAIQAAERNVQERNHMDVEKMQSEHLDSYRCKVSSRAIPFPNGTSVVANESVIMSVANWQPAMVDASPIKDDATIRHSPNRSPSASLLTTSCLISKRQVELMPVTTIGSSAVQDLGSNQAPKTKVEDSLLPNDAFRPRASWGREINT